MSFQPTYSAPFMLKNGLTVSQFVREKLGLVSVYPDMQFLRVASDCNQHKHAHCTVYIDAFK